MLVILGVRNGNIGFFGSHPTVVQVGLTLVTDSNERKRHADDTISPRLMQPRICWLV
jgi:hypothetical protein